MKSRRFPRFARRLLGSKAAEMGEAGYFGRAVGIASVVGVAGGLAAVGFDWLTEHIAESAVHEPLGLDGEGFPTLGPLSWWILLIPTLGGLLVGWITQRFAPEAEGHGTERIIHSFHRLQGVVRRRVIVVKALCSALTIGSGGSAGQEGPVAQIGSGIGSATSDALSLSDRDRRIFLLAGASAGIGALFTAPLGGALFAPEVLYRKAEFEGEAIIPCIVSSILAYTTFTSLTGETRAIPMDPDFTRSLVFHGPSELPVYLVLAVVCAVVGWLWVRGFQGIAGWFHRRRRVPLALRAGAGGFLLGALALGLTASGLTGDHGVLFGGYELMKGAIFGEIGLVALAVLILAKILATSLSIGSGGSGGVFAPSLAIGALCGALVGGLANELFPQLPVNPACFALVGMGAFFAGVAKTPISAVVMVCEMTGSYNLLAPLMLVSVLHLVMAHGWSIYETQVNSQIDSPAHAGDFVVDVLEEMQVRDVVEKDVLPTMVSQNATLRTALDVISRAQGSYFPVVDDDENLVGIFSLSDVRRIFLETDVHHLVLVRDFMVDNVVRVTREESLNDALRAMNELAVHALPVVDGKGSGRVVGMITRNNLGAAYHRRLRELQRHG
ncbi:H(+)/Cl(-) exchange transporter ClcA [Planctomycetes bacterium Pla163]|uniref:H(+)/Cl(-) exchange transporter ClcA n=1 Tax=Rohdeia mirabilis TaxID=2528008 RepID=A0A518CW66_9BACT|nr:H(+)/Cl(-) exchange transporter ClcA [Planctomycetes bacterium Pla163]